jgi:PAS domain S-box-containing protein
MDEGKRKERRYRAIFENMRNGVAVYQTVDDGRDSVFIDFNKAAEQLDGVRKSGLIGKRLLDVFPNADKFGVLASLQRAHQTAEPEYLPASYYRDEHSEGWRENFICKLPDGDIVAIYNDITDHNLLEKERLAMERKVFHAQQLESLGVMAGGIDYDFNNQLAVVLGNLELPLTDHNLDQETRLSIENAINASERSAELSRPMEALKAEPDRFLGTTD